MYSAVAYSSASCMVCTKMPAYFIATAQSMIIDSRGVFGLATCILRRGFCTSVLLVAMVMVVHVCTKYHSHTQATMYVGNSD